MPTVRPYVIPYADSKVRHHPLDLNGPLPSTLYSEKPFARYL